MECELSTYNAFLLDKIINTFPYYNITISTTAQNMTLQIIHKDSTVIMTITLFPTFFEQYNSKSSVFTVGSQKFHHKKCKKILLKSTEYKFIITWIFDDYQNKKEFYISEGALYHIKFEVQHEIKLNIYTIFEIVKHYNTKNITFELDNGLKILAKDKNTEIFCKIDNDYDIEKSVEVITKNIKKIFGINDICDSVTVLFEEEDKTINFVFENTELVISIFTATYS